MGRAEKLIADAEKAAAGKGEAYYAGVLQALVRQLCAEIEDLQDDMTGPSAQAGQFSTTVECEQCTAHIVWEPGYGERGIYDVRLTGNAALELGWIDDTNVPAYVIQAMNAVEMNADPVED